MFLARPDGTSFETIEMWKNEHGLILFVNDRHPDIEAFISRFQGEAGVFRWLHTRLLVVYPDKGKIPTPWPAPDYSPFVYSEPLPDGLEWGKGYLFTKNRSIYSVYTELPFLSAQRVEDDMLHWEAQHCNQ